MKAEDYFSIREIQSRFFSESMIASAYAYKDFLKKGRDAYVKILERAMERHDLYIINKKVTFDETLWNPADESAYENIVRIDYSMSQSVAFYSLMIDLRLDMSEYMPESMRKIKSDSFNPLGHEQTK